LTTTSKIVHVIGPYSGGLHPASSPQDYALAHPSGSERSDFDQELDAIPARFNIYGFRFSIRSNAGDPLQGLLEDFSFFRTQDSDDAVTLELFEEDVPREGLPTVEASVYTPRNVVYRSGGKRYIDYHGRALGIQDEATGDLKLYSRDANLLYEAAYLYLLSRVGEYLDRRGLHRIHALGVAVRDRGLLVLLPMGGGKSTLGLHLLNHPAVRLLSDDSPFIDRDGRLHAYPLRLGLLPGSEKTIPPEHRRTIQRMEFGPKHLVNYSYFRQRVCSAADPGVVMIGARTLSPECRIEEVGTMAGLRACIPNCVVGLGLFQGLEFILSASPWELATKISLGVSRTRNCWQLLRRSRVCRVHLGSDPVLNAQTVLDYMANVPD
jgi:hypothetical protein